MEGGVSVPPKLEPLNGTDALDLAEAVGAALQVGPNYVDVVKVHQVLSPQVALELNGGLDGGELVPDLDVLVMNTDALAGGVPDAMRLVER